MKPGFQNPFTILTPVRTALWFALFPLPACAITWDNTNGNAAWSTPANWDTDLEPTSTGDVVFPTGLAGTVTLASGENAKSLQFDDAYTLSSGGLTLASASTLTVATGFTSTINTPVTVTGGTTKLGAGTLVLVGSNTFTGGIVVNSGILGIGHANAIGSASNSASVATGATLQVSHGISFDRAISLAEGGTIAGIGTATNTGKITIDVAATSVTLATDAASDLFTVGNGANDVTGGSGATVIGISGPGAVRLGGTSDFDGSWNLPAGRLELGATGALGDQATSVTLAGGSLSARLNTGSLFTGPAGNLLLAADSTLISDRTSTGAGVNHTFGTLSMGSHTLTVEPGANSTSVTAGITLGNVTLTGNPVFAVNDIGGANGKLTTGSWIGGGIARTIIKTGSGDLSVTGGSTDLPIGSTFTSNSGETIEMLFPDLGIDTSITVTALQNPFGSAAINVTNGTLRLIANGANNSTAQTYVVPSAITLSGTVTLDPDRKSFSGTNKSFELPGLTLTSGAELSMAGDNTHGLSLSGSLVMQGGATLKGIDTSGKDGRLVLAGGISGTPGADLTIGGGTSPLNLTISAASTYDGGTTMNAGNVTLGAAAAFGTGSTILNGGTLTLNADGALTGSITLNGGTLIANGANILAANPVNLNGGQLDLRNNGNANVAIPSLTVSGTTAMNFARVSSSGTTVLTIPELNVSGTTAITLTNGTSTTPFFSSIDLAGDLTLSHAGTTRILTITEDGSPRSFIKTGAGTLELEGASSHSGGTEVLAGVLLVEHENALGTGTLTLGATSGTANATAQFSGGLTIANDFMVRAGSTGTLTIDATTTGITWNGGLSLAKSVTIDIGTGTSTYNGQITGSGAITKISGGELIIGNAANSFLGNLSISSGTLTVASDGALGDATNNLSFANTTTFKITGAFATSRSLSFPGASNTINVTTGSELTVNSAITGASLLTKSGPGTLAFGPAVDSSPRGAITTTISDGTLRLQGPLNLSAAGLINLNTTTCSLALAADANTDFVHPITANGTGAVIHVDRATGGSGINGRHTLGEVTAASGNLIVTGANGYGLSLDLFTTTGNNTLTNNAPGTLILDDLVGNPSTSNSRIMTFSGSGDIEIAGTISEVVATGSYAITKTGSGTLRFGTSVSDFSRITLVRDGTIDLNGIAYAVTDLTLGGAASSLGASIVTGATGSLDLADQLTFENTSHPPGASIIGNLGLGTSVHSVVVNDSTGASVDLTIDGPIAGGAGGTLSKSGTGTLRFSGAGNTLNDSITVTAGLLELAKSSGNAITTGGLNITGGTVRSLSSEQIHNSAPVALSSANDVILDLADFTETTGNIALTQTDANDYSAVRTGPTGTLILNGDITFNNNCNSSVADPRNVLITGSGTDAIPATDGTLDLGGALRTVHVTTTVVEPNVSKANATIETQIINGGILKTGPRTLYLNHPNNTFSGGLQISEGSVKPATFASLGAGMVTFANTGASSAVIDLGTLVGTLSGDLTVAGSGSGSATILFSGPRPTVLTLSSNITLQRDLTFDVVNGLTMDGESAMIDSTGWIDDGVDTFGLVKIGNGTLRLDPGNTFSGGTTLQKGILKVSADSSLGDSTAALTIDGGCFHPTASINSARDLTFGSNGGCIRVDAPIQLEMSGVVTWGSGLSTFFGSGTTILSGSSLGTGGDLIIGEHIDFAQVLFTPTFASGHVLSLRGTTSLPSGNLKMVANGVLELGSGNFSRALGTGDGEIQLPTSEGAGWAAHGNDRSVNLGGASAPVVWGQATPAFLSSFGQYGDLILGSTTATHTLDFQNPIELDNGTTFIHRNLAVRDGPAALDARISGGITQTSLVSFTTLELEVDGTLEISGPITGDIDIEMQGPGTVVLSGDNSRSGSFYLYGGTMIVTGDDSWNTPDSIYVETGAELDVSALTFGIGNPAGNFIGVYGTLTGDISTPSELGGNGLVDGSVHALADAYLYPDTDGQMHITGDFTLDANAFIDFFVQGLIPQTQFNQMRVGGAVNLSGGVYLSQNGSLTVGDSLVFIHNDGIDPISGVFTDLPEGTIVPVGGGLAFQVTYLANGDGGPVGNDFGVTVVADTFNSDLFVTATAPASVDLEAEFAIDYLVESTGPGDVSDALLTIAKPATLDFTMPYPSGATFPTPDEMSIPLNSPLPPGTTHFQVNFTAPPATEALTVVATVSSNTSDPDNTNDIYSTTTAVLSGGTPVVNISDVNLGTDTMTLGIDSIPGINYVYQHSLDLVDWEDLLFITGDGDPILVQENIDEIKEFFRFGIVPQGSSGGGGGGAN